MKNLAKLIVKIFFGAAIFVGVLSLIAQNTPEAREVTGFIELFDKIKYGDSEAAVISVLGRPIEKHKEFSLGQEIGFEQSYKRAEDSKSTYYLFWYKGIDFIFTIGINDEGEVCLKEYGGT